MSRTTKAKNTAKSAKKALAAVYRRKNDVMKGRNKVCGDKPGCWRSGLDQSVISGLQTPRFNPGEPSHIIKKFHSVTGNDGKWPKWIDDIASCFCGLFSDMVRLKDNFFNPVLSGCAKCFSPVLSSVNNYVPSTAPAVYRKSVHFFRAFDPPPSSPTQQPLFTIWPKDDKTVSFARGKTTMIHTDDGIQIRLSTNGYIKDNITVEVEGNWLVIEALATNTEQGGGYLQRHMVRRYELPPQADLRNISVELDERKKELRVTVPTVKPKVTFT